MGFTANWFQLLKNQFISAEKGGDVYNVTIGSGMGLICSADVSNAAFYILVEHDAIKIGTYESGVSLLLYGRYMDDIITIVDGERTSRNRFLYDYKSSSTLFKVKWESVSSTANFLDVEIFRG